MNTVAKGAVVAGHSFPLRYAKALLLNPAIASLMVCSVGLTAGSIFLLRSHADERAAQQGRTILPALAVKQAVLQSATVEAAELPPPARIMAKTVARSTPVFTDRLTRDRLAFLKDYAGMSARDVIREPKVLALVDQVLPYVPFHYGLDMPATQVLERILHASQRPVEIRDGRYWMVSGHIGTGGNHGFLWIDMQEGIAVGGIFFWPTNGEPTPTLTLFSKQVQRNDLRTTQLPAALMHDLDRWGAFTGVPVVSTRYFINARGEKTVLVHDEDLCTEPTLDKDVCTQRMAYAADIDEKAKHFLALTHYASNATMHMVPQGRQSE